MLHQFTIYVVPGAARTMRRMRGGKVSLAAGEMPGGASAWEHPGQAFAPNGINITSPLRKMSISQCEGWGWSKPAGSDDAAVPRFLQWKILQDNPPTVTIKSLGTLRNFLKRTVVK